MFSGTLSLADWKIVSLGSDEYTISCLHVRCAVYKRPLQKDIHTVRSSLNAKPVKLVSRVLLLQSHVVSQHTSVPAATSSCWW